LLFSSFDFIYLFLPTALLGFLLLNSKCLPHLSLSWLIFASLFFYGWWNFNFVFLILGSIVFNYLLGCRLQSNPGRFALPISVSANLFLLGWYKYAGFFSHVAESLSGVAYINFDIVLPIGISFFTFQQIAWLVDCRRGETLETSFLRYCLFVTFFPQLIAGPIVHHREMMPQFLFARNSNRLLDDIAIGTGLLFLGLAKKVLIADRFQPFADAYFAHVESGMEGGFVAAVFGVLAYSLQLYFDFSAYSDMATGIAKMFGIKLPVNFMSPYKARNIQEFWSRWHMTLSRFLKDYLYIPLGGNKYGRPKQLRNIMVVMLLGGFWHGASWTFVVWGGLHGTALVIYTLVKQFLAREYRLPNSVGIMVTFFFVTLAWVPFRAQNFDTAILIYMDLFSFGNIFSNPSPLQLESGAFGRIERMAFNLFLGAGVPAEWSGALIQFLYITAGMMLVFLAPNTIQLFPEAYLPLNSTAPIETSRLRWLPSLFWAISIGLAMCLTFLFMFRQSVFLYFQF
jgi:alginate O-acetyltransferase complex protein AlgI